MVVSGRDEAEVVNAGEEEEDLKAGRGEVIGEGGEEGVETIVSVVVAAGEEEEVAMTVSVEEEAEEEARMIASAEAEVET